MRKIDLLVAILLDVNGRVDERDDAAMYLGEYDDDKALNALLTVVLDPNAESFIKDVCGESIARIWVSRNYFDLDLYKKMDPVARRELHDYVVGTKPERVKKYRLG